MKNKLLKTLLITFSSLFILSGCGTLEAILDPDRPEIEAIPSLVDKSVERSRMYTAKVLEAELRCKQNIFLAQGVDDAAKQIEAELETLKSSPAGDINALTTAYNNTKDIEIDYDQKLAANTAERKAFEKAAIEESKNIMKDWFAYMGARSETYSIMKPYLEKEKAQYKEDKKAREENRPPRMMITPQEKEDLRVMRYKNHRGFFLRLRMYWDAITTAYDAVEYLLNDDDITSDEKDELNAMMKELDDAKVQAKKAQDEESAEK